MENLSSVLKQFEYELKKKIHTCIPCKVVAIENARVDVQPVFKDTKIGLGREILLETGEYVKVEDYEYAIIQNCPIVALINSNCRITLPISVGDEGLLLISERDINNWKDGISDTLDSLRKFNINDGFFIPFINQTITNYTTDAIEINYKGKKIKISDSLIEITGDTKITGKLDVIGNTKITGNFETTGTLKVSGDATIGGISFLTHTHNVIAIGSPTGAPQ
jgi:Phage protein Gp138 N-terminal domain